MPGTITHAAIALMARDRIRQIRDALRAKELNGLTVNDIERQVRYLAEKAYAAMSNATPTTAPPFTLYTSAPGTPGGDQVSKFLLMGAVGPDIPDYAALFTEGQGWLKDTLHKGTPDANREQVLVASCNLALAFWNQVRPLIDADFTFSGPDTPEKRRHDDALLGMQAYVLGHFCHVATDVLSAPFVDNLEWQLGTTTAPARPKLSHDDVTGALDVEVSRKIFRRGSETRGNDWVDWWPTPGQVPGAFFTALHGALEESYGSGAERAGLAAHADQRAKDAPLPLSRRLLRDGYESFRTVLDTGAAWDYWDWLGATWFMFLPSLIAYPLAMALPNGKDYFRATKPPDYDDDKALFELIELPFALNALVPIYYTITANASYLGAESEVIVGWVSAGVQTASAVTYLLVITGTVDSLPLGWTAFGVALGAYLFHIIWTLHKGAANPRRLQLLVGSILPIVLSFLFIGLYWAFLHTGVEKILDPEPDKKSGEFAWRLVVWFLLLFGLWWLTALLLRFCVSRRLPGASANDLVAQRGHHIRLFDDSTLMFDVAKMMTPRDDDRPTLLDFYYPSGRRPLLKLWWDGAGTASVIAHRDKLELRFGSHVQIVPAPPAGTRVSEFADYLQRNVKDGDGNTGLKAELFYAADVADPYRAAILALEDHELAPRFPFSDEGDAETTVEARAAKLGVPQPLRKSDQDPYVLYHAPKAHQSVRFDRLGPTLDADDEITPQADGAGTVNNPVDSHVVTIVPGPNVTKFTQFFRPGDRIEIGAVRRVIVSVDSDEQLTISTPSGAPAGSTFRRLETRRREPLVPPSGWQVETFVGELHGVPGVVQFGEIFRPGDTITVKPASGPNQSRMVMEVLSDRRLVVDRPLDPPLNFTPGVTTPKSDFERAGEEPEHLVRYLAGADDTLQSGGSIMNHAADLATLLCLGATSQLLSEDELAKSNIGTANDLNRAYQVFRNWNLDRRRENEWKMLVLGGAVSEKRGDPSALDTALPPAPGDFAPLVPSGEQTVNNMGWVNVLRSWVEMARSAETDTKAAIAFRPGNPTNQELSRAMAYLLDMRDPG